MKTQAEIVIKAKAYAESIGNKDGLSAYDYVMGYSQCQEDMAEKKYTEEDLHTILRLRKEWYSHTDKNVVRDFINSLNKQDNEHI
jgi:hypothetical protein